MVKQRIDEIISPVVWHFCWLDNLLGILKTNTFRLSKSEVDREELPGITGFSSRRPYYMCTTRSKNSNDGYSFIVSDDNQEGYVRLTLDGEKLNNTVHGKASDYFGNKDDNPNGKRLLYKEIEKSNKPLSTKYLQNINKDNEREDTIWYTKPVIANANRYIKRIDVLIPSNDAFQENKEIILTCKESARKMGIPFFLYKNQSEFDKQNNVVMESTSKNKIRLKNGYYDVEDNILYWNDWSLTINDCVEIQKIIKQNYGITVDITTLLISIDGDLIHYTELLNNHLLNNHWKSDEFGEDVAIHLAPAEVKHDVLNTYLSDRSENLGKKLQMANGEEMPLAQWRALHTTSEDVQHKIIVISEAQADKALNETHGVSNDYLTDLVDFIIKNIGDDDRLFNYREIAHCFDKFPDNLKKFFKNSKLYISSSILPNANGRCEYNVNRKLIKISLRRRDLNDMRATLFHELTHMIDYAVAKSSKGDSQTKVLTKYNDKFINHKSQYSEFNHIIYGFTNLEMRGRLASFKIQLSEWVSDWLNSKLTDDLKIAIMNGYDTLFQYYKKQLPYTRAYQYVIARYEEQYNSYVKHCKYGEFGYRGIIEMFNNLKQVIDPSCKQNYNEKKISQEEFEKVKEKVVGYFDNLINNYKKQIYKVAMDVWYSFIESLKKKFGNNTNFKLFMKK